MTSKAKEWLLYGLMILAAVIFASADAYAEFDGDEQTKTTTSWVKHFRRVTPLGWLLAAGFPLWLLLHFTWDGFPL